MRLIRWTTEAADQLEAAIKRIQQYKAPAGREVAQAIIDRVEQLAEFPGIGRPGEMKGTRELVSPPYVVVYRYRKKLLKSCISGMVRKTGANPSATLHKGSDRACECTWFVGL